jgi:hypothetical protein
MLTLRNNAHRWILATIVKSGNRRFWGWPRLFFVTFFWLLFFLEPKLFFHFCAGKFSSAAPIQEAFRLWMPRGELRVRKKGKPSKFCQHCKAKGSPQLTHSTKECHRYDGMGNPGSLFQTKPAEAKKTAKKGCDKQMAYLSATVETLVKKGLKKAMKGKKHKRNHAYDSSSSDSDSK